MSFPAFGATSVASAARVNGVSTTPGGSGYLTRNSPIRLITQGFTFVIIPHSQAHAKVPDIKEISSVAGEIRNEVLQVPAGPGDDGPSVQLNRFAEQKATVRIVIYSDEPILAAGMESLIGEDPDLESVGCCSNLPALKDRLANGNPDLAVVDLTPQVTLTELTELQSLNRECKLILWTGPIARDAALQALTIGIRGVLRKTLPLEAHRQCLHNVHSGELWVEKSLADSLQAQERVTLTPREGQLVALLARGLKNKEIAAELGLTEGTVKVYLAHLFQKSGARDRFELAVLGIRNSRLAGAPSESHSLPARRIEWVA